MHVLLIKPGEYPEEKNIDGSLKSMQALVGGLIQAIYPFDDDVALVCNVESLLMRSKKAKRPEIRAFCLT